MIGRARARARGLRALRQSTAIAIVALFALAGEARGADNATLSVAVKPSKADETRAAGATPATEATEIVVKAPARALGGTSTQTLTEPRIEAIGASNVGQTLETLPALHASQDSRGERVLTLRGFSQRQVAVFVDGIPVLVPYDGQLDLSKFPIDMIGRITVVKGSSATLYGPNGLGGAINLSTREPRELPWLRARTESSLASSRTSVASSTRAGAFAAIAGASVENQRFVPLSTSFVATANEDGGRRNNSDRNATSVAVKSTIELAAAADAAADAAAAHRLVIMASRFGGTFGVPPATRDFAVRYWRWTDWSTTTLGAGHEYRGRTMQSEAVAYVSLVGNTLDGYDDARYRTQRLPRALHSVYDDVSVGMFARASNAPPLGAAAPRFRVWAGAKRDSHTSFDNTNPEKNHVASSLLTVAGSAEVDPWPQHLRASAALQLDGELPEAPSGGVAPGMALGTGSGPLQTPGPRAALGPMGALSWLPSSSFTLTVSAAVRTRFPTLRERFSTVFGTREPNPGLRPERALNLGLDAAFHPARELKLALGLFDSELSDLITTVVVAPQTERQENVGKARLLGTEAQVEWAPAPWLELLAGGLWLRARSGPALDDVVRLVPATKGLAMATVRPSPRVAVSAVGRWIGPQRYANPNTGVGEHLEGYGLFDARAEWILLRSIRATSRDSPQIATPTLKAWVRATNLIGANVEGRYSFPEAGRQAFVGLSGETP